MGSGYVDKRLEAILGEISASLDALDEIVFSGRDELADSIGAPSVLVLLDAEEFRQVDRNQVETAQAQLPKLHQALEKWLASARIDQNR